jgi:hypothetical protein
MAYSCRLFSSAHSISVSLSQQFCHWNLTVTVACRLICQLLPRVGTASGQRVCGSAHTYGKHCGSGRHPQEQSTATGTN